jgi:hypothetical protein
VGLGAAGCEGRAHALRPVGVVAAVVAEHRQGRRQVAHEVGGGVPDLAPGVPEVRDMIDVAERDAGRVEAPAHRLGGERAVVLDPGEPLLFAEGDDLPVVQQCGGGVVVLAQPQYEHRHSRSSSVKLGKVLTPALAREESSSEG